MSCTQCAKVLVELRRAYPGEAVLDMPLKVKEVCNRMAAALHSRRLDQDTILSARDSLEAAGIPAQPLREMAREAARRLAAAPPREPREYVESWLFDQVRSGARQMLRLTGEAKTLSSGDTLLVGPDPTAMYPASLLLRFTVAERIELLDRVLVRIEPDGWSYHDGE